MDESFKVGIKSYAFHHRLRELRGSKTQEELAIEIGITIGRYQVIETLRRFPTEEEALKIGDYFDIEASELFPKWSYPMFSKERNLQSTINVQRVSLESKEVLQIEDGFSQEKEIDSEFLKRDLGKVLATLTTGQRRVIEMRFGLKGSKPMTLEETGKILGVSRERVRQIEARALRIMHHPSKRNMLRDYLD